MKTVPTRTLLKGLVALQCLCTATYAGADTLSEMASPVSNPVNFEDPRITSELRAVYLHHKIDKKFVTGGGDVDIVALQARYALTDRLALIATKDGYVWFKPKSVLNDGHGFANVAAGAKYAFHQDACSIGTVGLRYEIPVGEKEVLQGNGDGIVNPFISGATALGAVNVIGYSGLRIPIDSNDSTFFDASIHFDTKLGAISPLFEVNLFNVLDAGSRSPIADEGQDFFNLGSSLSENKTIVTGAAGARMQLAENISVGAAYEFPMARGQGTYSTDWRVTTDLTVSF